MLKRGKREESMKIRTYYLVLAVFAGFLYAAVPARSEQSLSGDKPPLISQSHPAFAEIDKLHVVVLQYGVKQDKDTSFYKQLQKDVKEKLCQAGIELETPTADNILSIPELRIYISTLGLEDTQQQVFHIRMALARAVCLKDKQIPVFKSDIWQTTPAMQIIPAENISETVSNFVLEQVEEFIKTYKATNPTDKAQSNVNVSETASSTIPGKQVEAAEYKCVASKSSAVFHKPDCRWAGNISKTNLVTYNNKDQAIKAGKRPCKTCNP
jgi:hypothetical protein